LEFAKRRANWRADRVCVRDDADGLVSLPAEWTDTVREDLAASRTLNPLIDRLLAGRCEICGQAETVQVHQIRKLSDLERPDSQTNPNGWESWPSDGAKPSWSALPATPTSIPGGLSR
jgi:hypothetical protein